MIGNRLKSKFFAVCMLLVFTCTVFFLFPNHESYLQSIANKGLDSSNDWDFYGNEQLSTNTTNTNLTKEHYYTNDETTINQQTSANKELDTTIDWELIRQKQLPSNTTSYKQDRLISFHINVPMVTRKPLYGSNITVEAVNCKALFRGDQLELKKAAAYHESLKHKVYEINVPADKHECDSYLSKRQFMREHASKEEEEFPIAFAMLVYKDFHQFEKLLRAIYRPHNYYCIHVDLTSDSEFKDAVQSLVDCFQSENIFVSPVLYDVVWGTITDLKPEIECMAQLWQRFSVELNSTKPRFEGKMNNTKTAVNKKPTWKYYINLTGQEFPLRTMLEIVRILKIFNGSNNVGATTERMNKWMTAYYASRPAPRNLTIWKGSVHVALTREFVDYVLHHPVSKAFLKYIDKDWMPEEVFFNTLNNNPTLGVPGSYTGQHPETDNKLNRLVTRFKNWGDSYYCWPCRGRWVRQICHFGVGDLPLLASRDELFANKFDYSFQPLAYDCMEELFHNRTRKQYDQINKEINKNASESKMNVFSNEELPDIHESIQMNQKLHDGNSSTYNNRDHFIFPGKEFTTYGDDGDGYCLKEKNISNLVHYLTVLRPSVHEPGEVDFEHYRNLDSIQRHFHVPDDWVVNVV